MALYNYLNRIERLDSLIRHKCTGTPKELAKKLDISERWLYIFLDELKTDLGCPIRYDRKRRSYVYDEPGKLMIGFTHEMEKQEIKKVSGGSFLNFFSHCIYRCSEVGYVTYAIKKFGCDTYI